MLMYRFGFFFHDIPVVPARHKVRKITVIADNAQMPYVPDTIFRRLYHDVEIGMSCRLLIIGHIPVAAIAAQMLGITVAHARCGVYGSGICMPLCFRIIRHDLVAAGLTGIGRVPAFRTGRFGHDFSIIMTESRHIVVLIGIATVRTGMRGIALFSTGGRSHFVLIAMPRFVHECVRILVAARRTEMRDVPLMRTGRRHGNVLKGMPFCRNKIIRIAVAAIYTGINGTALLRTSRRNCLCRFVVMLAGAVYVGSIHCRRAPHFYDLRFCRLHSFRTCTADHCKSCNKSDCKNRKYLQKFLQIKSPYSCFAFSCNSSSFGSSSLKY